VIFICHTPLVTELADNILSVGKGGAALGVFDKMLSIDVPFMTNDTGGRCGYGTPLGMPMSYFGGMGPRQRTDAPYLDDDCDILGKQFNVGWAPCLCVVSSSSDPDAPAAANFLNSTPVHSHNNSSSLVKSPSPPFQ
jgi:hypothetical protein